MSTIDNTPGRNRVVPLFEPGKPGRRGNSAVALDRLRQRLSQENRPAGGRLAPERVLAAELGVGRRALRRALDVLETEGLLTRIQGSGTFIGRAPRLGGLHRVEAHPDPLHVVEARLELEPILARLAAIRASAADVANMRRITDHLAAAVDSDGTELWDGALHRAIAEAAGNPVLFALFDALDRVRQDERWRALRAGARTTETLRGDSHAHGRLIEAIERADGTAAEAAMRAHLECVSGRLRQVIADAAPVRDEAGA